MWVGYSVRVLFGEVGFDAKLLQRHETPDLWEQSGRAAVCLSMEDPMSNSNQQDGPAIGGRGPKPGGKSADFGSVGKTAKGVLAKTSNVAGERVSTIAGQVKGQVTEMLDRQVHGGGDVVGHFAVSARRAADDLEGDAPQIASLVRTFAGRAEGYAADLRNQSTEQLVGTVSDFTRRQPALVFGMAALAGFLTFRALKNAAPAGPSTGDGSRRAADDGSGRGAV